MSICSFIATDFEMPEISSKIKQITVKEAIARNLPPHELVPWENMDPNDEVLFVENEEDFNELIITKNIYYDVTSYANAPYLYEVSFIYKEHRARELLEYLKTHIKEGQTIELWKIWFDDLHHKKIPSKKIKSQDLTLKHLQQLYDWNDEAYKEEFRLIIEY